MDNVFDAAEDGRTNPYCESESKDARDPKFDLVGGNLARYRFYGPILDEIEERDLIRRAQAGDAIAVDRLVRSHARTVLKIAGEYYGPTRDDLTAAGFRGLIEAIKHFNLSSPYGLRAYSESWIRKFISEEAKGKFRPIAPQTIAAYKAAKHPKHYSTTDYIDDGDGTRGWDYGSDKPDRQQNPVPIDPPGYYGVMSQFARNSTRAPWNGRWWQVTRNKRVYGPLQDGRAVEAAEWRRLLEMSRQKGGRQRYADELVERDNRKAKHGDYPFFPLARAGQIADVKPTPRLRQTLMEKNPCLTLHTSKLHQTRSQRPCSPSRPGLPKPQARNLRRA
jgi:hypothetical protein